MEEHIEKFLTSQKLQPLISSEVNEAGEPDVHYGNAENEYRSLPNTTYNARLALVPEEVAAFARKTQPKQWDLLVKRCGTEETAMMALAERVSKEIDQHGIIKVLREVVVSTNEGAKFTMMYPRPVNDKNPEHLALYAFNRLGVMRQLHYSLKETSLSIDMGIFLNGLPIITLELKNELTGQHHHNAVKQYMMNRDVKGEKLLEFKRCLVHFAVSTEQVFMTTKLDGKKTYFMPYNKTFANIGVESEGYRTDYLWKDVLRRDSVIDLISHYVNLHTEKKKVYDKKTGQLKEESSTSLIFPRWHQRRAVKKLLKDIKERGAGHNYLIQHSAGSGKSHTITWLAFRLSSLYQHYTDENALFDSVIVVNDRVALDTQMQRNFKQFEQTAGEVC